RGPTASGTEAAPGSSEVDLGANPEEVVRPLRAAVAGEHRVAEHGVLPVEVDLDELVEVPVAPDVHQPGAVGPESRVGQALREDPGIEEEIAVPGRDLPRTEAEAARAQVERAE